MRGDLIRLINHPLMRPVKEAAYRLRLKHMDYSGQATGSGPSSDRPPIDPRTARWLQAQFAPDLARLERLLGYSLEAWQSAAVARLATHRAEVSAYEKPLHSPDYRQPPVPRPFIEAGMSKAN